MNLGFRAECQNCKGQGSHPSPHPWDGGLPVKCLTCGGIGNVAAEVARPALAAFSDAEIKTELDRRQAAIDGPAEAAWNAAPQDWKRAHTWRECDHKDEWRAITAAVKGWKP